MRYSQIFIMKLPIELIQRIINKGQKYCLRQSLPLNPKRVIHICNCFSRFFFGLRMGYAAPERSYFWNGLTVIANRCEMNSASTRKDLPLLTWFKFSNPILKMFELNITFTGVTVECAFNKMCLIMCYWSLQFNKMCLIMCTSNFFYSFYC